MKLRYLMALEVYKILILRSFIFAKTSTFVNLSIQEGCVLYCLCTAASNIPKFCGWKFYQLHAIGIFLGKLDVSKNSLFIDISWCTLGGKAEELSVSKRTELLCCF